MNCFHLGGRAFHSRSLPLTQQGCAALNKTPAGERHTKKASLLQRSRHPIRVPSTPALAHAPLTHQANRAPTHTYALLHVFDSRATHARTLLPAALASVPFGFVLVRVRVRGSGVVRAVVGVDMRVERLGEEEGVEGCRPMVVQRASGEVGVLDTMGVVHLGFLELW